MLQDWFTEARLGIFLHWGIYSTGEWSESWDWFNGAVDRASYMAQAATFDAGRFDPDAWAEQFERAGAKYAVLTTKHHDGFPLWDTRLSAWNAKDASAAKRDLVGPYCEALRKRGIKVGLYFSHLDWSHPEYATVLPSKPPHPSHAGNRLAYPEPGHEDPAAWERYLTFHRGQLKELCERYRPDLLWFDGDWERDGAQWRFEELRDQLQQWAPGVVLNSRMGGYGDYGTPEQAMPIRRPDGVWELCVTLNDSWGYRHRDQNFKTVRQCVRMLAECAGMGGNLLLGIGPRSDGSIPDAQAAVLDGIGRWTSKHEVVLHRTQAGLPTGHWYGPSILSHDRETLYLVVLDRPIDGVAVKGIRNKVLSTRIIGGQVTPHRVVGGAPWANLPGELWIDVPPDALDADATVIAVTLEGPLDLYTGSGHAVTHNP